MASKNGLEDRAPHWTVNSFDLGTVDELKRCDLYLFKAAHEVVADGWAWQVRGTWASAHVEEVVRAQHGVVLLSVACRGKDAIHRDCHLAEGHRDKKKSQQWLYSPIKLRWHPLPVESLSLRFWWGILSNLVWFWYVQPSSIFWSAFPATPSLQHSCADPWETSGELPRWATCSPHCTLYSVRLENGTILRWHHLSQFIGKMIVSFLNDCYLWW